MAEPRHNRLIAFPLRLNDALEKLAAHNDMSVQALVILLLNRQVDDILKSSKKEPR